MSSQEIWNGKNKYYLQNVNIFSVDAHCPLCISESLESGGRSSKEQVETMFEIYYQKNITYISRWRSVRRLKIKEVDQGYHMGMGSAKSMKHNVLNSDLEIQSDVFGEIVEVTLGSMRPTNRKIFFTWIRKFWWQRWKCEGIALSLIGNWQWWSLPLSTMAA